MEEEKKNNGKFIIKNEEGKEVECEILFTCELKETGKNYMVYTDGTSEEDGSIKCYASIYDPEGVDSELKPVETEKEWELLNKLFESLEEKFNKEEGSSEDKKED